MPQNTQSLLDQLSELWNTGKLELAAQLYSPDAERTDPTSSPPAPPHPNPPPPPASELCRVRTSRATTTPMPISKTVLLILLCSGSAITQRTLAHPAWLQDASDPNRASIDGIVEDEYGQPLADATVTATPPGPLSAILPQTRTDTRGRFSFAGLHPGHTYVEACKEDAFYPCGRWSLWGTGSGLIEIELRAGTQVSGVLVSVSPAARLRVRAVDAATGATIDRISVRIERAGEPNRWIEGGKEIWLIPPSPVRVRVDAQGFASSWYSESGREGQPSPILLAPRQDATIVVPLRSLSPSPGSKGSTGPLPPGSLHTHAYEIPFPKNRTTPGAAFTSYFTFTFNSLPKIAWNGPVYCL